MSKIFEALEQIRLQREKKEQLPQLQQKEHLPAAPPAKKEYIAGESSKADLLAPESPSLNIKEEMVALHTAVESLLPDCPNKLIQFIGSRRGEGTSTMAREFAKVSAYEIGKTVLLLDADRCQPSQHQYFDLQSSYGWVEALQDGKPVENAFSRIANSPLFVSPSCNSATFTPKIFDSKGILPYWQILKNHFDLVIIDTAPLSISPDGLAFAPKVDGVIMVMEAETTRWKVAEDLKEKITAVGGNLLGIVLNKRRYYIPDFIYKRM